MTTVLDILMRSIALEGDGCDSTTVEWTVTTRDETVGFEGVLPPRRRGGRGGRRGDCIGMEEGAAARAGRRGSRDIEKAQRGGYRKSNMRP